MPYDIQNNVFISVKSPEGHWVSVSWEGSRSSSTESPVLFYHISAEQIKPCIWSNVFSIFSIFTTEGEQGELKDAQSAETIQFQYILHTRPLGIVIRHILLEIHSKGKDAISTFVLIQDMICSEHRRYIECTMDQQCRIVHSWRIAHKIEPMTAMFSEILSTVNNNFSVLLFHSLVS